MKKLYSLILLLAALVLVQVPAMTQTNPGLFFMEDCTTLSNPVPFHTACVNIGSGGTLTQGSMYVFIGEDEWSLIGPATTPTLETVTTSGNSTTKCTQSDPCLFGNGTIHWKVYCDDTNVCIIETDTAADSHFRIMANQNGCLPYDVEGTTCMETIDPDAATPNAMWQYASGYRPRKTIAFRADALYANSSSTCADPTDVRINSGPQVPSVICTDNAASQLDGSIRMPDSWDGGTLIFKITYVQTAADTGSFVSAVQAQCRASGAAINSTFGTAITITDAAVTGSNAVDVSTSTAVTPNGTCSGGSFMAFQWFVDASTTTAMATLNILEISVLYTVSSRSD